MKKQITFSALLLLILATGTMTIFNSCNKLVALNLSKDYSNIDFVITAPQAAGLIVIEDEITSDLEALASSNGFDINKIESANLKSVTLTINDPNATPVTFDIVDAATGYLSADNQTVLEVASDDAVQTSATEMTMDLKGVDVAPYLKSSKFKFKVNLTTNAPITHDVPMNAKLSFSFKVTPLK
ncbi:MAG: hypothetical protein JNJ58_06655 [Chitinophagaceae bacterium]|nr:hypothetical protein [Chitinophagaceae bacterium]